MFAPICRKGSMIRFMGREFKDSSPDSLESKGCPARIPEISLVVVPLFPTSRRLSGAVKPWSPFPCIRTESPFFSISIPSLRKQSMVDRQSAPWSTLCTSVVPLAMEPNMMLRWEMDLSPGTVTSPFKPVMFVNSIMYRSFPVGLYTSYTIYRCFFSNSVALAEAFSS